MVKSVLIIDDSSADRFFLKRALGKISSDFEITEFAYADDALEFLRSPDRLPCDTIFVDINMPRKDGFDFVTEFSALYPELRGNARLFLLSSSINPDDKTRATTHEVINGFLSKPLQRNALSEMIS